MCQRSKSVVIWRYGNKNGASKRASERANRRAMNSVYDAYFPGLATPGYFIIVATSRLQRDVHARVRSRRRDFRDRDGKKDSQRGCVFSGEKWDRILSRAKIFLCYAPTYVSRIDRRVREMVEIERCATL